MESNNNNNNTYNYNKSTNRFKSVSNIFTNKLSQFERSNSNINSSTSKKTAGFEESLNYLTNVSKKMNSFSNKKDLNNLRFSANIPVHQSQEFSMKDIKDKNDANGNYTNINISIVNPNFSINNYENSNSPSNITNKRLNNKYIINNTLLSFKESNNVFVEDNKTISKKDCKTKMIASIYKDYIENKSNEETFSENFKEEGKKNMFKEYIKKNKIMQYEYNTKGNIAGISAYMYPNEEKINKDKICLNININKSSSNEDDNEKEANNNYHLINFFSIFSGGEKDTNVELTNYLKTKFKDIILKDEELITNPQNAIKNSFIKCELNYIKKILEEKEIKKKNMESNNKLEQSFQIPSVSLFILLNIDDIFYIGNVGNIVSILSCDYSKKINYISQNNENKVIPNNINDGERKSINSLFNCNDEMNNFDDIMDKSDFNNSQMLFNSNPKTNLNNNLKILNNILNTNFIRTFPGKTLYDLLYNNTNNNINNNINNNNNYNILNKNISNKRGSKNKLNRKLSTTFSSLNNFNFDKNKNKNLKVNNYFKDNNKNLKTKNSNTVKERDSLFGLNQNYAINNNQNYNKFYRASFMSQSTYNDIFPENKIISSYPDIVSLKYQKNCHDFILIGCKIIFEKLSYDKICKGIYETMKKCIIKHRSFEMFLGCVVKDIIKKCISLGVTSNISCLFICFEPIKQLYIKQDINLIKNILVSFYLTLTNKKKCELYDNFLNADFIDLEKAKDYNNLFKNEIENINKAKKNLNTNIINSEIKKKIIEEDNSMKKNEEIKIKVKKKVKNEQKKCCCLIF